jgi:hypothetical protein
MEHFGREPLATSDSDYIPAMLDLPLEYRSRVVNRKIVRGTEFVSHDTNSPDPEVRFHNDDGAKHKSIYLDFHNNVGERNLELVCHYNSLRREFINAAVKEMSAVHGEIKTVTVTMARANARVHLLFLQGLGFKRIADPNRTSWAFSCDLTERRLRKKHRTPRPKRVVDVKPEPKPEPVEDIRFTMSVDELRAKQDALDALRLKIRELEDGGADPIRVD